MEDLEALKWQRMTRDEIQDIRRKLRRKRRKQLDIRSGKWG